MIESIAMLILNTIALIAILVARSELAKALREIDKLSSSRASLRAEAADARSLGLGSVSPCPNFPFVPSPHVHTLSSDVTAAEW